MKADIHPQYFDEAKVTCVCGNTFTTGATVPQIRVEICSNCHPFFTGEMKFVDTLGRVEKFQQKQATADKVKETKVQKVAEKEERKRPESLKEMFELVKKQASS
jgi:large subunit ribosomal protein L31